jgi:hypothetical protein
MNLDKEDLKAIGDLMDKKMLYFNDIVVMPVLKEILDTQKNMQQKIDDLEPSVENLENNNSRIERKLDAVTDMLAVRVTDQEKRIIKLELAVS